MSTENQGSSTNKVQDASDTLAPEKKPPVGCATDYAYNAYEQPKTFKDFFKDPKSKLETLGLIVLIFYTIFAGQQSCTMSNTLTEIRKQTGYSKTSSEQATIAASEAGTAVAQARDQFREDQRPYVWISKLEQPQFMETPNTNPPTGQIFWNFFYQDFGKSPAYNLLGYSYIRIGGQPFRESYGEHRSKNGVPLVPTRESYLSAYSAPGITRDEFQRLLRTRNSITVRIRFEYVDSYGCSYESHVCVNFQAADHAGNCEEENYITDCKKAAGK